MNAPPSSIAPGIEGAAPRTTPLRVLFLGATGFLGYHAVHELLARGHAVTAVARSADSARGLFPPSVRLVLADASAATDEEMRGVLAGHDAAVFGAGLDDRAVEEAPAYPRFHKENVVAAERFFRIARAVGVTRGVLLGSYLTHFARTKPELQLAEHHPYIRSRVEQEDACLAACSDSLSLTILQIPFVFGSSPGRTPIWKPLLDYLAHAPGGVVLFPGGGTCAVSATEIARAVAGALEREQPGHGAFVIANANLEWSELLSRLAVPVRGAGVKVLEIPAGILSAAAWCVQLGLRARGLEAGMHAGRIAAFFAGETFADPEPARRALGCAPRAGELDEAFAATAAACGFAKKEAVGWDVAKVAAGAGAEGVPPAA